MRFFILLFVVLPLSLKAQKLYQLPANVQTQWVSFENPSGAKGKAAQENKGAKGHAADVLKAGKSTVLLDVKGGGTIRRIWMTIRDRSPVMLRSLRLDMYWDGSDKPAVSVPLGDFFGVGLGRMVPFQNALFSDPEGRSFNCYIPMPFKKGARIVITNESNKDELLFYDIDLLRVTKQPKGTLYFHAYWSRNNHSKLGQDFNILPKVKGEGRFLGCNLGIIADSAYGDSWWGEGEVKVFLDGDSKFPSLAGTGTEDYIGTAWGQGAFDNQYQGCLVADTVNNQWAFYRYHIPDPVYFHTSCRVAIQQIGGDRAENVRKFYQAGADLIPVMADSLKLLEMDKPPKLTDTNFPTGWTNFYRLDNYSATAYFYLDSPISNLPPLALVNERIDGLVKK